MDAAAERLQATFSCQLCDSFVLSPSSYCTNGHHFCASCSTNRKFCQSCEQSELARRPSQDLRFPCKYSPVGCQFLGKGVNILKHEDLCSHASFPCPLRDISDCTWCGNLKATYDHCRRQHTADFHAYSVQKFRYVNFLKPALDAAKCRLALGVYEELFVLSLVVDFSTGLMRWCMYHVGDANVTDRFAYQVKFETENGDVRSFRGPCVQYKAERNDGVRDEECQLTTVNMLKKSCFGDDLIFCVSVFDIRSEEEV